MKFYILLLLLAVDIIAAQITNTTTATTATTLSTTASTRASTASTQPSTASTASTTASTALTTASTRASTASSTSASTASRASTASTTASTASTTASTRASTASSTSASTASRASTASSTSASTASRASTASSTSASTTSRASTASSTSVSTTSRVSTASSTSASTTSRASTASSTAGSTASSTVASTAASTAAPTTPKPSVQQNFTCKDGNTTKFSLTGSFALFITYNKTNVGLTTIPIEVPQTKNFQGTCGNTSTESLTFAFFNGWSITYVFQEEVSSENGLLSATNKYYVSNITVVYVHDEHLPDTTTPEVKVESKFSQDRYLEATTDGYYTCQTNISLAINKDVTLTTSDFKYKAFNNQGDINLDSGTVYECPTDEETNSIVPIAVGAALAGLVIIVLIAYLIGRKRSRKTGYETV